MKKSILLLSALACFSLVGCGSSNKDTSKEDSETGGNKPGTDESEKNPTVVEKTLTLNEGVAAFNKIIEALPQTETAYGINNDLSINNRSETIDEGTNNKYITITTQISNGSVSIGENKLWYKNKQKNHQISRTEDQEGNSLEEIKYNDNYDEELFEKLDTTGFGYYKCTGKEITTIKPEDTNNPNDETAIDEKYQIDGADEEFTSYVQSDVSSTLESATYSTLSSFAFLAGNDLDLKATVKLAENTETKTQTYTFSILDDVKPDADTIVYTDKYAITVVIKDGLLANFNYMNDFKYELNNGYREHSLVENNNTIDTYTKITYPDTTGVEVATDLLNVTPWGQIILGFEQTTEE